MEPIKLASRLAVLSLAGLVFFLACSDREPTAVDTTVGLAEGGSPGPDPVVDAADPPEAPQNTTLDVRVLGANFDNGSTVRFLLGGRPTKGIVTNSTQFQSAAELIANITIAVDADTAKYDIEVTTSKKRRGVGTEMFTVKQKTGYIGTGLVDDASQYSVGSDGRGVYVDHQDCVIVNLFFSDGVFQLRTIANSIPGCKEQARGVWRFFRLALGAGNALYDFDQDGTPEALEEAPGRLIATRAFHVRAEPTPVQILILEVIDDVTGTTAASVFEIVYQNDAHITVVDDRTRVIFLEAGEAAADVCEYELVQKGKTFKRKCIHKGSIDLPFRITAEAVPAP